MSAFGCRWGMVQFSSTIGDLGTSLLDVNQCWLDAENITAPGCNERVMAGMVACTLTRPRVSCAYADVTLETEVGGGRYKFGNSPTISSETDPSCLEK